MPFSKTLRRRAVTALLILAAAGGLALACGGGSYSDVGADATPSANLMIRAKSLKFDKKTLVAPPATNVTVTFENAESAIHNFAVYTDKSAKEKIFVGENFVGPKTVQHQLTTPAAGSYYFRCDVHPDTMTGTFLVKDPSPPLATN
jgi:plastocyanin